jgi:hypothetical protein
MLLQASILAAISQRRRLLESLIRWVTATVTRVIRPTRRITTVTTSRSGLVETGAVVRVRAWKNLINQPQSSLYRYLKNNHIKIGVLSLRRTTDNGQVL